MQFAYIAGITLAIGLSGYALHRSYRANTDLDTFVRWFLIRYEIADEVADEAEFELVEGDVGPLTEN